jgi:hypothetical protein
MGWIDRHGFANRRRYAIQAQAPWKFVCLQVPAKDHSCAQRSNKPG